MITDIIYESLDKPYVKMSKDVYDATNKLRKFMFDNVYIGSKAKDEKKVKYIVKQLYEYFVNKPYEIPDDIKIKWKILIFNV